MEVYTLFDELVIFSFITIWMGFSVFLALLVNRLLLKKK